MDTQVLTSNETRILKQAEALFKDENSSEKPQVLFLKNVTKEAPAVQPESSPGFLRKIVDSISGGTSK